MRPVAPCHAADAAPYVISSKTFQALQPDVHWL